MSYILDALKKLENEKEKKSRADGMVNISGALLRGEPRRTSSGIAWKVAVVVVLASLVTFGTTWFMLHADKRQERPVPPPVVQSAPVAKVAPPVAPTPVAPVQQPAPVSPAAVTTVPPAPAPIPTPNPNSQIPSQFVKPQATKPKAAVTSVTVTDDNAPPVSPGKQALRLKKQKKEAVRPVEEPSPAVPAASAVTAPPADIKVSGIAWQDERSARRAVVNGFLTHEGSAVSGARITEILKDRVRFSTGDKTFEAPLLMTVTPGTGK